MPTTNRSTRAEMASATLKSPLMDKPWVLTGFNASSPGVQAVTRLARPALVSPTPHRSPNRRDTVSATRDGRLVGVLGAAIHPQYAPHAARGDAIRPNLWSVSVRLLPTLLIGGESASASGIPDRP